jgi:hypothetical protein
MSPQSREKNISVRDMMGYKKKPHLRRGYYESTAGQRNYLISANAAVAVAGLIVVDNK